jgi:hypothetical protein
VQGGDWGRRTLTHCTLISAVGFRVRVRVKVRVRVWVKVKARVRFWARV